ncbi:MAG: hypothetical protein HZA53_15125, partial [Planctomycetes bacterium]|nr:hypothetical protein [Planctomycetota bacterium]
MTTLHWEWPAPGPCDLARAFEALSFGVQRLEGALVAGRVEPELEVEEVRRAVGPLIAETYSVLARRHSEPYVGERRRATIKQLLDETRAELVRLERTFPAAFAPGAIDPERGLGAHAKLHLTGEPPRVLRLDQAIAARFWGVGFHFESAEDGDHLARAILRDAARGLAADLSDLNRILARIRGDERFPPLVPPLEVRAFERLMLDLLNEHRPAAVKAPLEQDYSQKTDLRYDTERGLGRQRGARVQITSLTDFALHQAKLDQIENRDKLVLLSPIELARWVDAEVHGRGPFHVPLERELLARLWSAIGAQADVRELVNAFGRVFQRAQRTAPESPFGPLTHVPEPVRELVRLWVDLSALRSTRLLRAFEDRFGQDSARG